MNRPRDSIASAAPASTRLATLRQVLGDRRRAGSRLRRSLWVSLLAHLTLFFVALPIARHPEGDRARDAKAERAVQLITIEPPQPQVRPEPLEAPQPEPEPEPEPEALAERLEFLRSQREQQGKSPDSRRISTHDRSVQDERVARSRARVADGSQDRGKRAGSPSKASQAGSTPQLPAPSTPLEQSAQVQARSAPTQPRAPSAERPRLDERPCGGQAGAGPCDAVLQTRGDQGPALEPDAPQQAIARADQRLSTSPGRVSESGREGWSPLAVRAPGLAPDATPFARAILPDRTAPSDASKAAMVSDEATPTVKPAPSPTPRRPQQPKASRTARATGSAQDQPDETAQAAARPTVVEPAPSFDVEPLELMRQQQRRDAAGGHRVSAVSPPEVVDIQTALSTRQHPLAEVLTALDDQLREGWIIPLEIRVSGIVGTTGVRMVVDPRGRISEVALTRPSGHPHLDQLAQAAVPKRIDGFSRLLTAEARDAFPEQGLHLYYEFAYRDSPVVGVY